MTIVLNGNERELGEPITVAALVAELGRRPQGTAVAVNGHVVPRSRWEASTIREGDRVEVLEAVAGG